MDRESSWQLNFLERQQQSCEKYFENQLGIN